MKYIDAYKLISEIQRREKIIRNSANQISDSEKKTYYSGCADALLELLPFISSLQQEQLTDGDDGKFVNISVMMLAGSQHYFDSGRSRVGEQKESSEDRARRE